MFPGQDKIKFTPHDDHHAWAEEACAELIAGCTLNIKLVKAGLWPKLLCDMQTVSALAEYAAFIENLGLSLRQAKEAISNRGH